jgi:hypothetical protein
VRGAVYESVRAIMPEEIKPLEQRLDRVDESTPSTADSIGSMDAFMQLSIGSRT